MTKNLLLWLSRLMPLMMAIFLIATFIQLGMLLHVSPASILRAISRVLEYGSPFYLPAALIFLTLTIIGIGYYLSAERLARQGLRHRETLFTKILGLLINSKNLTRLQREYNLDAEEFATTLSARVVGQEEVCKEIAQQLRRRLALRKRTSPIGAFLFTGPAGTGKTLLAQQIAIQTGRPLLQFSMAITDLNPSHILPDSDPIDSSFLKSLANDLVSHPDAIILLNDADKAQSSSYAPLLLAWNDGFLIEPSSGRRIQTNEAIFILTTTRDTTDRLPNLDLSELTGLVSTVLNRLDRIFFFRPLQKQDLARIATLETEKLIKNYGLTIETGGMDPSLFLPLIQQQYKAGTVPDAHRVTRLVEDMFSDTLITARQQKHTHVRINPDELGRLFLQTSAGSQNRLNKASS